MPTTTNAPSFTPQGGSARARTSRGFYSLVLGLLLRLLLCFLLDCPFLAGEILYLWYQVRGRCQVCTGCSWNLVSCTWYHYPVSTVLAAAGYQTFLTTFDVKTQKLTVCCLLKTMVPDTCTTGFVMISRSY